MEKPSLGLTTQAHVIRVVDADTCEVEIKRKFKVRIKDLLCEEKKSSCWKRGEKIRRKFT
jgi:hypothetical protein